MLQGTLEKARTPGQNRASQIVLGTWSEKPESSYRSMTFTTPEKRQKGGSHLAYPSEIRSAGRLRDRSSDIFHLRTPQTQRSEQPDETQQAERSAASHLSSHASTPSSSGRRYHMQSDIFNLSEPPTPKYTPATPTHYDSFERNNSFAFPPGSSTPHADTHAFPHEHLHSAISNISDSKYPSDEFLVKEDQPSVDLPFKQDRPQSIHQDHYHVEERYEPSTPSTHSRRPTYPSVPRTPYAVEEPTSTSFFPPPPSTPPVHTPYATDMTDPLLRPQSTTKLRETPYATSSHGTYTPTYHQQQTYTRSPAAPFTPTTPGPEEKLSSRRHYPNTSQSDIFNMSHRPSLSGEDRSVWPDVASAAESRPGGLTSAELNKERVGRGRNSAGSSSQGMNGFWY
ncbi:hypothetical protein HK097_003046 [Rhizophlyctis rosea]|uniref:Uncharacterized protein n=1 Tax=Rhizophlyctis rosea TaxID=64517 RepID=A0AAD5SMN9_9FUNG|nr:hypothetical protein HK097_003046 [Rhizophlyctis rosea]